MPNTAAAARRGPLIVTARSTRAVSSPGVIVKRPDATRKAISACEAVMRLLFLRRLITRRFGVGFGHEFPFLGISVVASALVVDASGSIHPDLT